MGMSRRDFFRRSAVTAAGLYVAPDVLDALEPRRRYFDMKPRVTQVTGIEIVRCQSLTVRCRSESTPIFSANREAPIAVVHGAPRAVFEGVDVYGKAFRFETAMMEHQPGIYSASLNRPLGSSAEPTLSFEGPSMTMFVPLPKGTTREQLAKAMGL